MRNLRLNLLDLRSFYLTDFCLSTFLEYDIHTKVHFKIIFVFIPETFTVFLAIFVIPKVYFVK